MNMTTFARKKRSSNTILRDGSYASKIPEYMTWQSMINRCRNSGAQHYGSYGGRGITVCEEWLDFLTFIEDMGRRPSDTHSLDRIDNNDGYNPNNCRWTISITQQLNKRPYRTNSSGYRGVVLAPNGKWIAQISHFGKMINLGYYKTKEDAALAFDCAAVQLRGNDAQFNLLNKY